MIIELLKGNAAAAIPGNAGALQDSTPVSVSVLRAVLYELLGSNLSGFPLPAGFLGATGGVIGGLPMYVSKQATSLNSPAGATPALMSYVVPAGTLSASGGFSGLGFFASGSFANNVNAKTITASFGGGAAQTGVVATVSTANLWTLQGSVLVRTSTSVVMNGVGNQSSSAGAGTPTAAAMNQAITALNFANALTLQIAGTQTAAADIIQDTLVVWLIP